MNLEELYLKRQSTRKYSDKKVADEDLEKNLQTCGTCPFGKEFTAVENVCHKRQ